MSWLPAAVRSATDDVRRRVESETRATIECAEAGARAIADRVRQPARSEVALAAPSEAAADHANRAAADFARNARAHIPVPPVRLSPPSLPEVPRVVPGVDQPGSVAEKVRPHVMLVGGFATGVVSGQLGPAGALAQRGIDAVVERHGTAQDRFNFGYGQAASAVVIGVEGATIAAGGSTIEVGSFGAATPVAVPAAAYGAVEIGVAVSHMDGAVALMSSGAPNRPAETTQSTDARPLAGADRAVIDRRKLDDYALDPNHPVGGNKAKVFESALGYNRANADELLKQLRAGATKYPAIPGKVDSYGARFTVDIPVNGPKGSATVRTGWIVRTGSDTPELTTLFVK